MDGATVTRSHCTGCPSFVSFRMSSDQRMVGCAWGDDVTSWLRREMRSGDQPSEGRADARAAAARGPRRRVADAPARPPHAAGSSIGFFLAALGLGIARSAWDRPS